MRRRLTTTGVLGAVFALILGVTPVLGAVSGVGTVGDPGHPAGRSPTLPFAGSAVPVFVSAPSTVVQEANTDNDQIKVFDEKQDVTLAAPLAYDQLLTLTDGGSIAAGTVVDSHYVHFDNTGTTTGRRGVGTITFACPIIGLITQDRALIASDGVLGHAGTTYPAATLQFRGLEQGRTGVGDYPSRDWRLQDVTGVSADKLTLFVDLQVFNVLDQLRVVTEGRCPIDVDIDIKPGSFPNSLNNDGHGVIPVAILGSATFDVTQIDVTTLAFAGLGVRVKGNGSIQCSVEDVSGDFTSPEGAPDGFDDLVCQFVDDTTTWDPDNGTATVTGELFDGTPFEGSDSINFVD